MQPQVDDLSAFAIGGRGDAAVAIAHAIEAERLGFRRVFVTERYNSKEGAVLMGAMAARTSRVGVDVTAMPISARLPILTASIGTTIHAMFRPRCVITLARGQTENNVSYGLGGPASYEAVIDYANILRRLWRGDPVTYDGPAGSYKNLVYPDLVDGPQPEILFIHYGGPKASKAAANPAFDGSAISCLLTPEAVQRSISTTRAEREHHGLDPAGVHCYAMVASTPDTDSSAATSGAEVNLAYGDGNAGLAAIKCFLAIALQQPQSGRIFKTLNGWDEAICKQIEQHPFSAGMDGTKGELPADFRFRNRMELMDVANEIPDSWAEDVSAVGSTVACVKRLQEFRDAGADELGLYIGSAAQHADVIAAWRERPEALRPS